jgi:hypothetical protein
VARLACLGWENSILDHTDESRGSSNLLPLVSVGSDASEGGGVHYFRLEVGGLAFLLLCLAGVLDLPAEEDPRLSLPFEDTAADNLAPGVGRQVYLIGLGRYGSSAE